MPYTTNPEAVARQSYDLARANSDALIRSNAKTNAEFLRRSVLTDDGDARDVAWDATSALMTDAEAVLLTRLTVDGDAAGLLALLQLLVERAIVNLAEVNAMRDFERMTPNDFLPD